jgi:primosomal protein N' (replication factor Y)
VLKNDYRSMYTSQIIDRKKFHYPPFCRLIELTLKAGETDLLNEGAQYLALKLREQLGEMVLGPEFPLVARVKNEYLKALLIKAERSLSISQVKKIINQAILDFRLQSVFKKIKVHVDVDPI